MQNFIRNKPIGVSANIRANGIREFRVIWREPHPASERRARGGRKSSRVRTVRFPITAGTTEERASMEAQKLAAMVYEHPYEYVELDVNWEGVANQLGILLQQDYLMPSLTDKREKAYRMLEDGMHPTKVAELLGIHRTTVTRWEKRRKLSEQIRS